MHSFDSTFHRLLVKAIDEEMNRQREIVTRSVLSHELYAQYVGRLEGMRMVLDFAEKLERQLQTAA